MSENDNGTSAAGDTGADEQQYDADVIVIGGGPAGSTISGYLGRAGYKVITLERDIHPREHVGESLVPATNIVTHDLGFWPKMEQMGWVVKPGATWTGFKGGVGSEFVVTFADVPQNIPNPEYTYHVDRAIFDAMFLKHAQELGANVIQGAYVNKVLFEGDRAVGVLATIGGKKIEYRSKFVVDASGRRTVIGKQLNLREKDPQFNQFAIYSWFKNVKAPSEKTKDYIHVHFLPIERGWVWHIPIYDDATSVGVVVEKKEFQKSGKTHEEFFNEVVQLSKNTVHALEGAERIRPFWIEADYSYKIEQFAGPGWMLVGDAARFVDPIFSSGVSVAMRSSQFAFAAIESVLKGERTEDEALGEYDEIIQRGTQIWYEWITLYYKMQSLFTRFSAKKEYKADIQQLLQGEVFDKGAIKVIDRMKAAVKAIEETEGHMMQQFLGNVEVVEAKV